MNKRPALIWANMVIYGMCIDPTIWPDLTRSDHRNTSQTSQPLKPSTYKPATLCKPVTFHSPRVAGLGGFTVEKEKKRRCKISHEEYRRDIDYILMNIARY